MPMTSCVYAGIGWFQAKQRETHDQWLRAHDRRIRQATLDRLNDFPAYMFCCGAYIQREGTQCEGCGGKVGQGIPIAIPEIAMLQGAEAECVGQQPPEIATFKGAKAECVGEQPQKKLN
jgi:hypothetical protein